MESLVEYLFLSLALTRASVKHQRKRVPRTLAGDGKGCDGSPIGGEGLEDYSVGALCVKSSISNEAMDSCYEERCDSSLLGHEDLGMRQVLWIQRGGGGWNKYARSGEKELVLIWEGMEWDPLGIDELKAIFITAEEKDKLMGCDGWGS